MLPTLRYLSAERAEDEVRCIPRLARRAPLDDASGAEVVLRAEVIIGVIAVVEEVCVVESRKLPVLCIRINMKSFSGLPS